MKTSFSSRRAALPAFLLALSLDPAAATEEPTPRSPGGAGGGARPPNAAAVAAGPSRAEPVDLDAVTRIRKEGLENGKGLDLLRELCDGIGPRLVGSPGYRRSAEWAKRKLEEGGFSNVRLEPSETKARSWESRRVTLRMVAPDVVPMTVMARAFTPGTGGAKRAHAIAITLAKDEDYATWKGKLEGKVVLLKKPGELKARSRPDASRFDEKGLADLTRFEPGGGQHDWPREKVLKMVETMNRQRDFLESEKALALLEPSPLDDGTIGLQGTYFFTEGARTGPPQLVTTSEAYARVHRLLERKKDVELELELDATLGPADPLANANVLADLPGTDLKDEVVLLGAHLDSWHGATGATDNGAGVVAAMEALRILKAAGLAPRRTVRVALWSGEEVGYLGSRSYVKQHVATRPEPEDPKEKALDEGLRKPTFPLQLKAEHGKLSAVFNLDNGAGKVRGLYAQQNAAVRPVLEAWIEPLRDLGVAAVTLRNTGGTDHIPFDEVGIPAFQLIQDDLNYLSRAHHSTADVVEYVPKADLDQMATVLAVFAWHAAQRDELLPRKPLPADPKAAAASAASAPPAARPAPAKGAGKPKKG